MSGKSILFFGKFCGHRPKLLFGQLHTGNFALLLIQPADHPIHTLQQLFPFLLQLLLLPDLGLQPFKLRTGFFQQLHFTGQTGLLGKIFLLQSQCLLCLLHRLLPVCQPAGGQIQCLRRFFQPFGGTNTSFRLRPNLFSSSRQCQTTRGILHLGCTKFLKGKLLSGHLQLIQPGIQLFTGFDRGSQPRPHLFIGRRRFTQRLFQRLISSNRFSEQRRKLLPGIGRLNKRLPLFRIGRNHRRQLNLSLLQLNLLKQGILPASQFCFHTAQKVGKSGKVFGRKKSGKDLLPFFRLGQQQFLEIPLGNHRNLRKLLSSQTDNLFQLFIDTLDRCNHLAIREN